ncbi:hypothetical protein RHODO2019_11025 [Rhodococcus antarcticus]|uniref:Uncharacterized protein n=1 Tax=Rhodococcus antarcticus TaxID=2987751 RepID=A0ABY6NXS8_9NOCA|nr:hypothetical protein [Rhodococcus antarcticus]UZJ23738.1 hypothetical protein RHODO2019_11025 [Rhodococcus antarcticus]
MDKEQKAQAALDYFDYLTEDIEGMDVAAVSPDDATEEELDEIAGLVRWATVRV